VHGATSYNGSSITIVIAEPGSCDLIHSNL
jgi:hypothetical protein